MMRVRSWQRRGEKAARCHWIRSLSAITLLASLTLFGCGDEKPTEPDLPSFTPNRTPTGAVSRFIETYERGDSSEYRKLFTGDFAFEFSNADPELQQEWATGWFHEDEATAARNLFVGGVNMDGQTVSAARSIELSLSESVPADDGEGGRDPTTHKVLVALVTLRVELSNGDALEVGGANPARHRLFLVRGDAAVELPPDQPADAEHWYFWRWVDETQPGGRADRLGTHDAADPQPTEESTWGRVKGLYR